MPLQLLAEESELDRRRAVAELDLEVVLLRPVEVSLVHEILTVLAHKLN